ncbi:MAG TPA: hypothetical protein DIT32_03430 [Peptococcaceae bacterium]|nr:hypothetical protein [Peptococcaceae bacterium]
MELAFEYTTNLGAGANPASIHLSSGEVYLFSVDGGRLKAKTWDPGSGDVAWDFPTFGNAINASRDVSLSLYRLKNVPRVGMFGAWHQDQILSGETEITPERQRIGIWDALSDISKYLQSGSIRLDLANIVASATLTFKNPSQVLSGEANSRITPGNKIELYFTAGDSDEYPMGVFYVDRAEMSATGGEVSIDMRNVSGKILKDQTFNADRSFAKDVYTYVIEDILDIAGVTSYSVQQPDDPLTAFQIGMLYPADMDFLTGLNEIIKAALNWTMRETLDGQMLVGSELTFEPISSMYSTYQFNRGTDLFGRGIARDDNEVYAKVCYKSFDTTAQANAYAYADVTHSLEWGLAPHKTLYIAMPDDTDVTELQALATDMAIRLAYAGVTEQFTGPFRPHIIPGDEAQITEADSSERLIGLITTIEHSFGENGFSTSFTVDSGGRLGKPQLKDMITKANGNTTAENVKRLY